MNGLDLFTGIGGLALALYPWVRTVAYCEIDHYACGVLMSRMANGWLPHAPIWDDVTTLSARELAGARIDIITGGFPCQDISLTGSRAGLAGERSGLYREVIRLVGELRPRFVFLENVSAIRKDAHVVIGDLAGLGYDCRWTRLQAEDVGAPHKRARWWCLAADTNSFGVWQQPEWQQQRPTECWNSVTGDTDRTWRGGNDTAHVVADANGRRLSGHGTRHDNDGQESPGHDANGQATSTYWQRTRPPFPAIRGVDDGISNRVDRLRALGNAVVPQCAREAFRLLCGLPVDPQQAF